MTKGRGRAAMLLGLMFAAGLTVGLAVERFALHRAAEAEGRSASEGSTTIERFADQLGVTNEQRALIDPILVDTRARMAEIYGRFRPEWEAVVDSARAGIEAILTVEQVEEYRALLEEQDSRGRRYRSGGGSRDEDRD